MTHEERQALILSDIRIALAEADYGELAFYCWRREYRDFELPELTLEEIPIEVMNGQGPVRLDHDDEATA